MGIRDLPTSFSRIATGVARGKELPYSKEYSFEVPMITSKLTTKAQTTIPQPVRAALRLKEGDELAYEIEENRVILTKASAGTIDDPFATFGEWDGEADRIAYAKL
jgi:antitoxin PrlF